MHRGHHADEGRSVCCEEECCRRMGSSSSSSPEIGPDTSGVHRMVVLMQSLSLRLMHVSRCCLPLPPTYIGFPHRQWWIAGLEWASVCAAAPCAEPSATSGCLLLSLW